MAVSKERWLITDTSRLHLHIACKNLGYQGFASYKAQLNCFRIMLKAPCSEAVS